MGNAVIIVLLVILIALVAAGVYFLYGKKDGAAPAARPAQSSSAAPPAGAFVNMRSGLSGQKAPGTVRVIEMDAETFLSMNDYQSLDFFFDNEYDPEPSLIEQLRDPSVPEEERAEIAERLRRLGYIVEYPSSRGGAPVASPAGVSVDDEEEGPVDISVMTDVYALQDILTSPYASEEDKDAARLRLAELGDGAEAHEEPEPEPEQETGTEDDGNEGNGDGGYGQGYVDPLDLGSVEDPHPDVPYEPAEEAAEAAGDAGEVEGPAEEEYVPEEPVEPVEETVEEAPEVEEPEEAVQEEVPAPVAESSAEDVEVTFRDEFDADDTESRKAISLMVFIARSFKAGLISPELVAFAQDKLHLEVDASFWTPEQRVRARQRQGIYQRDAALVKMSIDEFDLHMREVVAHREAEGVEAPEAAAAIPVETTAPVVEKTVELQAEAPVQEERRDTAPVKGKPKAGVAPEKPRRKPGTRPVSAFFDAHGGKNDLMWARLDPSYSK